MGTLVGSPDRKWRLWAWARQAPAWCTDALMPRLVLPAPSHRAQGNAENVLRANGSNYFIHPANMKPVQAQGKRAEKAYTGIRLVSVKGAGSGLLP